MARYVIVVVLGKTKLSKWMVNGQVDGLCGGRAGCSVRYGGQDRPLCEDEV